MIWIVVSTNRTFRRILSYWKFSSNSSSNTDSIFAFYRYPEVHCMRTRTGSACNVCWTTARVTVEATTPNGPTTCCFERYEQHYEIIQTYFLWDVPFQVVELLPVVAVWFTRCCYGTYIRSVLIHRYYCYPWRRKIYTDNSNHRIDIISTIAPYQRYYWQPHHPDS